MNDPKVYDMQANDEEDMKILNDPEQRKLFIAGAIKQAKEAGCQVLSILDPEGKTVYVEGFA